MPPVKAGRAAFEQDNQARQQHAQQKENDPSMRGLKRLSSITALATPINQLTSKFRRPSTAVPPLKASNKKSQQIKESSIPRFRQVSNVSKKSVLKTPPPSPQSVPLHVVSQQPARRLPKSQTMSNLPILPRRESSYVPIPISQSSTNLCSRRTSPITLIPVDSMKATNQIGASRPFTGLRKPLVTAQRSNTQPNLPLAAGLATPRRPSAFRGQALTDVKEESAEKKPFAIPRKQIQTPMRQSSTSFAHARTLKIPRSETSVRLDAPKPWASTPGKPAKKTWPRKSIEEEYLDGLQRSPSLKRLVSIPSSPRRSFEREISHHSLLQPISPPLPRLPAGYADTATNPSLASARLVRQVSQAQPDAYWSGRYASLNDRLLNEALMAATFTSSPFARARKGEDEVISMTESMHTEIHAYRILDLLYAACVTEEAMGSLRQFQRKLAKQKKLPNVAMYTPTAVLASLAAQKGVAKAHREDRVFLGSLSGNSIRSPSTALKTTRRERSSESEADMTFVTDLSAAMPGDGVMGVSTKKSSFIDRLLMGKSRRVSGAKLNEGSTSKEALLKHDELGGSN